MDLLVKIIAAVMKKPVAAVIIACVVVFGAIFAVMAAINPALFGFGGPPETPYGETAADDAGEADNGGDTDGGEPDGAELSPAPEPTPELTPEPSATPAATQTPAPAPTAAATTEQERKYASAPTPEPEPELTDFPDNFVFPQAGLRPFAVMIDNEGSRPLPQGGLEYAQLIYEAIVEGGASRLMAVFWYPYDDDSLIGLIGPVRSARHYFVQFALEHDALYTHIGQSPQALSAFSSLNVDRLTGQGVFWDITKDKNNWQDSYTSTERLFAFIEKNKRRTTTDVVTPLAYGAAPVTLDEGVSARRLRVGITGNMTYATYEYDEQTGLYLRSRNGKPHMARETVASNDSSTRLTAKNILVQFVKNWRIAGDDMDRQDLSIVGSGEGYYVTNGMAVKILWSKASAKAPTLFTYLSGEPVLLNPGQTYIQVTPLSGSVEME